MRHRASGVVQALRQREQQLAEVDRKRRRWIVSPSAYALSRFDSCNCHQRSEPGIAGLILTSQQQRGFTPASPKYPACCAGAEGVQPWLYRWPRLTICRICSPTWCVRWLSQILRVICTIPRNLIHQSPQSDSSAHTEARFRRIEQRRKISGMPYLKRGSCFNPASGSCAHIASGGGSSGLGGEPAAVRQ